MGVAVLLFDLCKLLELLGGDLREIVKCSYSVFVRYVKLKICPGLRDCILAVYMCTWESVGFDTIRILCGF